MTKAIKETMSVDAKKAALQNQLVSALNISASESKKLVDGLYAKYGEQTKEIIVECLTRPYKIRDNLGKTGEVTSKSMLEYFNEERRSAQVIKKALAKSKTRDNRISNSNREDTKAKMQQDAAAARKAEEARKAAARREKDEAARKTEAGKTVTQIRTQTTAKKTAANAQREKLKQANIAQWEAYRQEQQWKPTPSSEIVTVTSKTTSGKATAKAKGKTATKTATKTNNGNQAWSGFQETTWTPNPIQQSSKVLTAEEKLAKAKGNKGYITFEDLRNDGIEVITSDLQAVVNKQKTLDGKAKVINSITPGKKSRDLGDWMAKNTRGKPNGNCLSGIQIGMEAGVYNAPDETSPISGNNKDWNDYKVRGKKGNSACDAHILLDKSGDWFTVNVPNKAYHNPAGNKEMQDFNSKLRSDILGSVENRAVEGSRGIIFENESASAKHGHIWVRGKNGENLCDGVQSEYGINFTRYGEEMYITLSSDSKIPDDLALEMIKVAEKRREQYSMLQENVYVASKAR